MAIPHIKIKTWGLQSKILILFIIALGSVLTAAYFVRENERILRRTLNNITEPDERLALLQDILTIIPEAENNLRYFALTNSKEHFNKYELLIDSVESNIRRLTNNYKIDTTTRIKFDSITQLLEQRKHIINSYIMIKEDREKYDFSQVALNAIRRGTNDSSYRTKTTVITVYDTLADDTITPSTENKKGLFNKIKKVFSKKEPEQEKENTVVRGPIIKSTTKIQSDTTQLAPIDSIKINLQKELSKIKQLDITSYDNLREKELNMLHNSSLIINQITEIFKNLEQSVALEDEMNSFKARLNASESLLIIGVVSSISLVLIMVLIILIFISIRKSNRYRKELILANIQANDLARVKEEFLANMSHEIRTPLNAIIGFTDLLKDTHLAQEQANYLNAVRQSSKHLLETVNDILDLSKLVAGKFNIEKKPFNFGEVINDAVIPFEIQAKEKGLKFIINCRNETDIIIDGDPLRLRQILYNLLSNAVKFTNTGHIKVDCFIERTENSASITIVVEDTGIGIPSDMQESIFEDFQQVETSSARTYGGSGLGLAISRRLARLHHGDIKVVSIPGKGSTFTLEIKYDISKDVSPSVSHESEVIKEELKNKNILIIDDDPFSILLSKIIAEKNEMKVELAKDGYKAIELIKENEYDLIMTDLQMPGLTGRDIIKYIRNHANPKISSLPVLAFTANKLERYDSKLIADGFNEVIQKPFLEEELIERIYFYLSNKQYPTQHEDIEAQDIKSYSTARNNKEKSQEDPIEYSLDQVKLFSGGHHDQERMIIESFINSSTTSLAEMKQALSKKNYAEIKNIAHRSSTAYQLFKVDSCVAILSELDGLDLNYVKPTKIKNHLDELEQRNMKLFNSLKIELRKLENA